MRKGGGRKGGERMKGKRECRGGGGGRWDSGER